MRALFALQFTLLASLLLCTQHALKCLRLFTTFQTFTFEKSSAHAALNTCRDKGNKEVVALSKQMNDHANICSALQVAKVKSPRLPNMPLRHVGESRYSSTHS